MDEEWYTATYTYASPLLRGMKIMRRNHHSDGAFPGPGVSVLHCA